MAKKSRLWDWFERFMHGVTFFHIAGLALMLLGGHWGDKGQYSGFGFTFTVTLSEIAGFIAFFRELLKSWLTRRKEARQGVADGP